MAAKQPPRSNTQAKANVKAGPATKAPMVKKVDPNIKYMPDSDGVKKDAIRRAGAAAVAKNATRSKGGRAAK